MATWNDWFVSAKNKNFNLERYLKVDQPSDLKRLYSSGLPCFDYLPVKGSNYSSKEVKEFIIAHKSIWVRVIDHRLQKRQSKLEMKNFDEFEAFLKSLPFNLNDCSIQLYQMEKNEFGGNVISSPKLTLIEIAYGLQDIVGKSTEPFFHGKINSHGRLEFVESNVPNKIILASKKVLSYLKKSRESYLEGYFEFAISFDGKVYFMDYKTGF